MIPASLRRLGKEVYTFAATCAVLLIVWISGRPIDFVRPRLDPAGQRGASYPFPVEAMLVHSKIESYEIARNFFTPPGKARLPMPPMALPAPPIDPLVLPNFWPDPSPRFLAEGGPSAGWEPFQMETGRGIRPSALDETRLQPILSLSLPVFPPRVDRRREKEFPLDRLTLASGEIVEGEIFRGETTNRDVWVVRIPGKRQPREIRKIDVDRVDWSETNEKRYQRESAMIGTDLQKRLALARKCLDQWGMVPEAIFELEQVLRAKPDFTDAFDILHRLYWERGEFDKAVNLIGELLRKPISNDRLLWLKYKRGMLFRRLGLDGRALIDFGDTYPELVESGLEIVQILIEARKGPEALKLANELTSHHGATTAHKARAYSLRALARLSVDILPETVQAALEDAATSMQLEPRADAHLAHGLARAYQKDYPSAHEDFLAAIQADPFLAPAWYNLGLLYLAAGKYAQVEILARKGLERDPTSADLMTLKGLAELGQGKRAEARSSLEKVEAMRKGHHYVHYVLGTLDLQDGRIKEGLGRFGEAIRLEFFFPPVYAGAARAYVAAGELVPAEALLRRALALRPTERASRIMLINLLADQDRIPEARKLFLEFGNAAIEGDGLLQYLDACLTYRAPKLTNEQRARDAILPLERAAALGYTPAQAMHRELVEWIASHVLVNDTFNREDSPKVRGGWTDVDRPNVPIEIRNGRCRISARKGGGEDPAQQIIYVAIERDLAGENLNLVEGTFYPIRFREADHAQMFGFAVLSRSTSGAGGNWRGYGLVFQPVGDRFRMSSGLASLTNEQLHQQTRLSIAWNDKLMLSSAEIRFRVVVRRQATGELADVLVWSLEKNDWLTVRQNLPFTLQGPQYKLAFFARGFLDAEYELEIDNVRVLERK